MGILAKVINGKLHIATTRVAAPGYTLRVADYSVDGPVQDGWVYYNDPEEPKRVLVDIDWTGTPEINARILAAFKDKLGQDTTAADIKLWLLDQVKEVVQEFEQA